MAMDPASWHEHKAFFMERRTETAPLVFGLATDKIAWP